MKRGSSHTPEARARIAEAQRGRRRARDAGGRAAVEAAVIQRWCYSNRADPAALVLADRHYNRQKPGTPQFVPPGSCVVFLSDCGQAFWVTSWPRAEYVKHRWPGAWICSAFRSEGAGRASELIRLAVAATRAHYGEPPPLGLVTFINRDAVRPIRVRGTPTWGWTWLKAAFVEDGETEGGLLALRMPPEAMPEPLLAKPRAAWGLPLFGFPRPAPPQQQPLALEEQP
jgi:hypothetical protein